jgi:transposase InsO family protein
MTKGPFNKVNEMATSLMHTDVCGPIGTSVRGGYSYFIIFTDDLSRYGYMVLMRYKSKSLKRFKEFQNEVDNQLGKKNALRSDRGGEYMSIEFNDHLKQNGIIPYLTPPGTPVEWCVRTEVSYAIGYGTIDDESGGTTFIFLGICS